MLAWAKTDEATSCCIWRRVKFTVSIEKFKSLTADVEFADEESFREKVSTIKESYFPKTQAESAGTYIDDEQGGTAQDVDTTDSMKRYMSAISRDHKASA